MAAIHALIRLLDGCAALIGKTCAWLVVVMVLCTVANVVLRYSFGISIVKVYEVVLWSFGIVFCTAAGWALLRDEHVRVDVFYRAAKPRTKAVINLLGTLLLLAPLLWLLWERGLPYVLRSWKISEGSQELNGINAVYLLKSFILVFVVTLAMQGLSLALKSLLVLAGRPFESAGADR